MLKGIPWDRPVASRPGARDAAVLGPPDEDLVVLQGSEPLLDPLLGFRLIDAVAFLHPAVKDVPVTGNQVQVVLREPAPPVPERAAHLRPLGLQLVPIHFGSPFTHEYVHPVGQKTSGPPVSCEKEHRAGGKVLPPKTRRLDKKVTDCPTRLCPVFSRS
jgi:hypothetical protein